MGSDICRVVARPWADARGILLSISHMSCIIYLLADLILSRLILAEEAIKHEKC